MIETLVPVFAALGDDTRWSILAALGGGTADPHETEMRAHHVVGMCVHYEHNREMIQRLGFQVPHTEPDIARLADSIAEMALHGIRDSRRSLRKRKQLHSR